MEGNSDKVEKKGQTEMSKRESLRLLTIIWIEYGQM